MPVTFSPTVNTSSSPSPNHEVSLTSVSHEDTEVLLLPDRFEKMPVKGKKKKEHTETKEEFILRAETLVTQLIKKDKALTELAKLAKNSGIAELNRWNGPVGIALNYRDKDLIEMLRKIETPPGSQTGPTAAQESITNYHFLLRGFQVLFGNESTTVTDWLKIRTEDSPYGEQLYNLRDLYRDWLSQGKSQLYEPITTHQATLSTLGEQKKLALSEITRLKIGSETAVKEQLSVIKHKEILNKKIEKLAKNSIKNQVEINRDSSLFLNDAVLEEKLKRQIEQHTNTLQELENQIPLIDSQLEVEISILEQLKLPTDLYEKKLVLLEILLGLDLNQDTGDLVRVQLIQSAITSVLEETKCKMAQIQAKSDAICKVQTQMQNTLIKYHGETSSWDKIWIRRDLKKLMEKAAQLLEASNVQ